MKYTLEVEIENPKFKVGDAVRLDDFVPDETRNWNERGIIEKHSLHIGYNSDIVIEMPQDVHREATMHRPLWVAHVRFPSTTELQTVYEGNLKPFNQIAADEWAREVKRMGFLSE